MARSHAATTCVQSDSIKGMAQSIAKPAYHRWSMAEPALRRAVPILIIAFLVTICIGAFVQVMDQGKQKRFATKRELSSLADLLTERLDHVVFTRQERVAPAERFQNLLPGLLPQWAVVAGRHFVITGADQSAVARMSAEGSAEDNDRIRDLVNATQLLTLQGAHSDTVDVNLPNSPLRPWQHSAPQIAPRLCHHHPGAGRSFGAPMLRFRSRYRLPPVS